jgi:hypothetical protein
MDKLAGDHNFVPAPRFEGAWSRSRLASRKQDYRGRKTVQRPQLANPANHEVEHADICSRKGTAVKQKSHIVM